MGGRNANSAGEEEKKEEGPQGTRGRRPKHARAAESPPGSSPAEEGKRDPSDDPDAFGDRLELEKSAVRPRRKREKAGPHRRRSKSASDAPSCASRVALVNRCSSLRGIGGEAGESVRRSARRPKQGTAADSPSSEDEGIAEEGKVCFDGLFANLQELKERSGSLTISTSHPLFASIVDRLSTLGMEELMKKRFYDQVKSLRDFAKLHGDCLVPADHPTLGEWLRLQREHYMFCKKRLPSPLTSKRFAELKKIPGFDEFDNVSKDEEEKKEDPAADEGKVLPAKKVNKEDLVSDEASPFGDGDALSLDEKIRLKTSANKVRLMARSTKGSASRTLADKKKVAAELRKKMENKTSYRLATRRSHHLHRLSCPGGSIDASTKERWRKLSGGENRGSSVPAGRSKERRLSASVPANTRIGSTFDSAVDSNGNKSEKESHKLVGEENYCSPYGSPMPASSSNTAPKHQHEIKKSHIDAGEKETGKNKGKEDQKSMPTGEESKNGTNRRSKEKYLRASAPANTTRGIASEYQPQHKLVRHFGSCESMAEKALQKKMLRASAPPTTMRGSNLDSAVDSYENKLKKMKRKLLAEENRGSPRPTSPADTAAKDQHKNKKSHIDADDKDTGNRSGKEGHSQSMPTSEGAKNEITPRSNYRRLTASELAKSRTAMSTFEERLRQKLDGESMRDIYGTRDTPEERNESIELQDLIDAASEEVTDNDIAVNGVGSSSGSGWRSKLREFGLNSKDDIWLVSRSDLGAAVTSKKFSKWRLVFDKRDYGDKREQFECVSSVFSEIIYSEKWELSPQTNGDITLEITTETLDEHKTVELYVQELDDLNLYSRSDFFSY